MPVLAAQVEDRLAESGFLTQTGITCTWHLLQAQVLFCFGHGEPYAIAICRGCLFWRR